MNKLKQLVKSIKLYFEMYEVNTVSAKKFLISFVLIFSLATASPPAQAWSIKGAIKGISSAFKSVATIVKKVVKGAIEITRIQLESVINTIRTGDFKHLVSGIVNSFAVVATMFTTCDEKKYKGIMLKCFSTERKKELMRAMDFIAAEEIGQIPNNFSSTPWRHIKKYIESLNDMGSSTIQNVAKVETFGASKDHGPTVLAFNVYGTDAISSAMYLYPLLFTHHEGMGNLESIFIGITLLHEADHSRFGPHTSGEKADKMANGPYGTGIKYLINVWKYGHKTLDLDNEQLRMIHSEISGKITDKISNESEQLKLQDLIGVLPVLGEDTYKSDLTWGEISLGRPVNILEDIWLSGDFTMNGLDDLDLRTKTVHYSGIERLKNTAFISVGVTSGDGNPGYRKFEVFPSSRVESMVPIFKSVTGRFHATHNDDRLDIIHDVPNKKIKFVMYGSRRNTSSGFTYGKWSWTSDSFTDFPQEQQWASADYDGNGIDDLAMIFNDGGKNSIYIFYKDNLTTPGFRMKKVVDKFDTFDAGNTWFGGSFDRNDAEDLFVLLATPKINSDGKESYIDVYQSTTTNFAVFGWPTPVNFKTNFDKVVVGDFDGDGKTDITNVYNDGGYIATETFFSSHFVKFLPPVKELTTIPFEANSLWRVGDYNGDGRDDLSNIIAAGQKYKVNVLIDNYTAQ